jgi:hypothetical protein
MQVAFFRGLWSVGLCGLCHCWLVGGTVRADTQEVIPVFDSARYEALWVRSPFGVDTAPVAVTEEGPSFAENLVISGIVRIKDKESLVLMDTRTKEYARATPEDGGKFKLISLHVDRDRRNSRAIIGYGEETAEIRFPVQKTNSVGELSVRAAQAGAAVSEGERSRPGPGRSGIGSVNSLDPGKPASRPGSRPGVQSSSDQRAAPPSIPTRRRVILPRQR